MFNVSMYQMKTIPEILTILGLVYFYLKCYFEVNKVDDLDLWCIVLKFDTFVIIVIVSSVANQRFCLSK